PLVNVRLALLITFALALTNWGYSHTNYVILGEVLERITGKPLDALMQEHVLGPMELTATSGNGGTAAVPEPVLHSYTSERREFLGIPAGTAFYEDATWWNPSWTTANGAVMTTNIVDLTRSMEIVGSGEQVSPRMHDEQVGLKLVDFGHQTPECRECRTLTSELSYGHGVLLLGPWIAQTKNFAGSGVTSAYLRPGKLAISVATTYGPEAFDAKGGFNNASGALVKSLAELMAPGQAPPLVP
ncbi:serine hydrolase domain-containing protein, partial [Ottowia sp.]|uniref:serine hydrolase domain-containing protein n=1 Tax=Ottowia sp. TaxID=1898956 RepID=UPI002BD696AE